MQAIPINYWAVLVAAIANMVLGALWFGPLFGKLWMKLSGMTPEQIAACATDKDAKKGMGKSYALMAVGSLVMAFVMAHALVFASAYMKVSGVSAGFMAGFWNWLGFVAPVTMGVVLWEGKRWSYWALTYSYYLVGLSLMGVILAMWV